MIISDEKEWRLKGVWVANLGSAAEPRRGLTELKGLDWESMLGMSWTTWAGKMPEEEIGLGNSL